MKNKEQLKFLTKSKYSIDLKIPAVKRWGREWKGGAVNEKSIYLESPNTVYWEAKSNISKAKLGGSIWWSGLHNL